MINLKFVNLYNNNFPEIFRTPMPKHNENFEWEKMLYFNPWSNNSFKQASSMGIKSIR